MRINVKIPLFEFDAGLEADLLSLHWILQVFDGDLVNRDIDGVSRWHEMVVVEDLCINTFQLRTNLRDPKYKNIIE